MVDWQPYLESICEKHRNWCELYTITDVTGKIQHQAPSSFLLDLMVETVSYTKENREKQEEKTERLEILEGIRKYSLKSSNHVLLQGKPGSGKSTTLKRLLLEEATQALYELTQQHRDDEIFSSFPLIKGDGRGINIIPILIQLRDYKTSILDLIQTALKPHIALKNDEIEYYLAKKQFFLLIDGINELPSDDASTDLRQFRETYSSIPMIFTTRELGLRGDMGIEKKLTMQPLTQTQMQAFIRGYLGTGGDKLFKQLGEKRLEKLAETPLMLWMLCSIYQNNGEIPDNLGETFRAFTHIYEDKLKADVTTQSNSKELWSDSLQYLAFQMTSRKDEPVIAHSEAEAIISDFLQQNNELYSLSRQRSWLKDLINHHLIQKQSEEQAEFLHQLIQEYYTAEYLLKQIDTLTDEQWKWQYLNYIKWTEAIALMLGLVRDKEKALRLIKLALAVDYGLGARLAGEVNLQWQKDTVGLVIGLEIPKLYKVYLLGKTRSDKAISFLDEALQDNNAWMRHNVATALGNSGSNKAVKPLIAVLEDKDAWVRRNAAVALGRIGSDIVVEPLIDALGHKDVWVRRIATEALGNIGSDKAVEPLIAALGDEDYEVYGRAAEALGKIGSDKAVEPLIAVLGDTDTWFSVRRNAALALIKIDSDRAVEVLITALRDKDDWGYDNAAKALGKIDSDKAVELLIKFLQEGVDDEACGNASEALGEIDSVKAVEPLIAALQNEDYEVRRDAAEALGRIGSDIVVKPLIAALEDESIEVRYSAAFALEKIGSDTAIPFLKNFLKNPDFINFDEGITFSYTIQALETIQENCKYYHPPQPIPSQETFESSQPSVIMNFNAPVNGVAGNVEGNFQVISDENR